MNARRWAVRLALLLLFGVGASTVAEANAIAPDATPEPAAVGPGDVYLALGDSVAAGVGAERPGEGGYAAILAGYLDRLTRAPIQRLNLAVPGETTDSLLGGNQLTWALRLLDAAKRNGVRVGPITITVGANDLLRAGSDPDQRALALEGVAVNLDMLLARLEAATRDAAGRPTADLVVTGYYDPTETPVDVDGSDGWWLAELDRTLAAAATRAGARWVDVAAAFRDREGELTRYPADIHPTDAGHRAIADAIWRVLGYEDATGVDGEGSRAVEVG
jgi:lysophospholipase L1-like esterase